MVRSPSCESHCSLPRQPSTRASISVRSGLWLQRSGLLRAPGGSRLVSAASGHPDRVPKTRRGRRRMGLHREHAGDFSPCGAPVRRRTGAQHLYPPSLRRSEAGVGCAEAAWSRNNWWPPPPAKQVSQIWNSARARRNLPPVAGAGPERGLPSVCLVLARFAQAYSIEIHPSQQSRDGREWGKVTSGPGPTEMRCRFARDRG